MGEIALRIYNHFYPSHIFYSGSYDRFRGKPFADDWGFTLNSRGFKDKEFLEKKEDEYRLIGIGDSFSFGVVPYEYNYLTLVESKLKLINSNIELLNMGIPSIGPKDYFSVFVNEGLELQPDMVLLSFFIGNDFYESKKRKPYESSFVASFFHYMINLRHKYQDENIHGNARYCDHCPSFDHEQYLKIEFDRSSIYLPENKDLLQRLDNALYYLKQIRKICEQHNIKLVVAIIPDELQINNKLLRDVKEAYYPDIDIDKLEMTRPNTLLSNELDKLNINNIDLYDYFSNSPQQLYRPRDTHWNIAGNQLAAIAIERYISKIVHLD
ncbi:alginate O-acetyltransferase AlgX-related protein [Desulfosediminicola flagellatus]|uniref:alginate O-acetyltransferase AlgX-related protein n=1 Tax=Desulfosediminicola flagellatus TaxID=2569541 RepID=UPI0010ACA28F|nr:hypothetical protein [Desulfosediminicola flagellatus]